jgi:dienelactone hydrolase
MSHLQLRAADRHGFNCTDRASHDAAAAHLAFARTKEFFSKHLG